MKDNNDMPTSKEMLEVYFLRHGLLFCGASRDFPSLYSVGGDWDAIVSFIEEGQVFYSKFYKNRVTYLSREFYANVKQYRQRIELVSTTATDIFTFLETVGTANTKEIKQTLRLSNQSYTNAMLELSKELLVTAIRRDETMNQHWSSFCWGTWSRWEAEHQISDVKISLDRAKELLSGFMSEAKINLILR